MKKLRLAICLLVLSVIGAAFIYNTRTEAKASRLANSLNSSTNAFWIEADRVSFSNGTVVYDVVLFGEVTIDDVAMYPLADLINYTFEIRNVDSVALRVYMDDISKWEFNYFFDQPVKNVNQNPLPLQASDTVSCNPNVMQCP